MARCASARRVLYVYSWWRGELQMITILSRIWWAVALRGAAAIVFGLIALLWPGLTLTTLVFVFGFFALLEGFVTLIGMFTGASPRPWWSQLLGALLSLAAGFIAIFTPAITALALLYVVAFWAILRGITDIVSAIELRKEIDNEWFLALSGVLSVVLGVLFILMPGVGILSLLWLLGVYVLVIGIVLVVLGFRMRGTMKRLEKVRAEGGSSVGGSAA